MKTFPPRSLSRLVVAGCLVAAAGCSGAPHTRYEEASRPSLVSERYNDTDLRTVAEAMVNSLIQHPVIRDAVRPPILMVGTVTNRTDQHLDVKSLTDMIRTALLKTGRVQAVDETARGELAAEYDYQSSGYVDPNQKKGPGKQASQDFHLRGDISSITDRGPGVQVNYMKFTMQLTDLNTNLIVWTDQKEIKKVTERPGVGW
ncbi:MAG: penicillin-binding protein activator LpoB [Planctomycetes bacterium]|nr:penicillin-binding protein activator LpoB [Planctomycetota bacterium]